MAHSTMRLDIPTVVILSFFVVTGLAPYRLSVDLTYPVVHLSLDLSLQYIRLLVALGLLLGWRWTYIDRGARFVGRLSTWALLGIVMVQFCSTLAGMASDAVSPLFASHRAAEAPKISTTCLSASLTRASRLFCRNRGAGASDPMGSITYHDLAADVAATIKAVVNGPVVVIGHAFGSRVARTSSTDDPELVRRLIQLAPAGAVPGAAAIESLTARFWETPLPREARLVLLQRTFFAPGNKRP